MYKKRLILKDLIRKPEEKFIMSLTGSRRTGKTTLINELKKQSQSPQDKIICIELKNIKKLMKLNEDVSYISELAGTALKNRITVIIDDFELLTFPKKFLKEFKSRYFDFANLIFTHTENCEIDDYFSVKFGKIYKINKLKTLNFIEFLIFKNALVNDFDGQITPDNNLSELKIFFNDFIKYGAYPEVVSAENNLKKQEILTDFINNLLQKDISNFGIKNTSKLYMFLKLLAEKSGELLNGNDLAKNLDISVTAVENYLRILEKLNIITRIKPLFGNYSKELKKMPTVYFNDLGVRNAILGNFDSIEDRFDKENYFKNVLFKILSDNRETGNIKFWRTQSRHEVDFIIDENFAIGAIFNARLFKKNKYKKFRDIYPNMRMNYVAFKDVSDNTSSVFDFIWGKGNK